MGTTYGISGSRNVRFLASYLQDLEDFRCGPVRITDVICWMRRRREADARNFCIACGAMFRLTRRWKDSMVVSEGGLLSRL